MLARSTHETTILRSGTSTSATTASSCGRPIPGDIDSVRHVTKPVNRLPLASPGSSSNSVTLAASAACEGGSLGNEVSPQTGLPTKATMMDSMNIDLKND